MYDPSMRVLTVLELLQSRGRLSGAELANYMEVSVRTVQRYIARLQDLGIPVASTRGPGGSYRLKPGFRLPPLMFGTDEAFAVALGLDALTYLGLGAVAPATAGVKAKLERVLPEAVGERVGALRSVLDLEKPRWIVDADVAVLTRLASAIHARQRVRLGYSARNGSVSERDLEPFGLMQHEGRWFLAGYCLLRSGLRLFRVDRVKAVDVLGETFERPEDFEMSAFLYNSIAFAPAPWRVEVWLGAPPEVLEMRLPRAKAVLEPEANGTRLCCGVADLGEFALLLLHASLQLGCRLEVRRPAELTDAFRAVAQRALEVARASPGSGPGRTGLDD
jgi:predicted DNA-binding transcriptional regulator YafY